MLSFIFEICYQYNYAFNLVCFLIKKGDTASKNVKKKTCPPALFELKDLICWCIPTKSITTGEDALYLLGYKKPSAMALYIVVNDLYKVQTSDDI